MSEVPKSDLRLLIETLRNDAGDYFREIARCVKEEPGDSWRPRLSPDHYWQQVSDDSLQSARSIVQRVVRYSAQVAEAMRAAPLVGGEDLADLRHATKAMRASIQLRRYRFEEIEVLNDEDRILGVRPAMQSDDEPLPPLEAHVVFHDNTSTILRILAFVEASEDLSPPGAGAPANSIDAPRYRPGTAFVMMWMDPAHPELTDICDAVKDTFQRFGINAVRADDIEHDGGGCQASCRIYDRTMRPVGDTSSRLVEFGAPPHGAQGLDGLFESVSNCAQHPTTGVDCVLVPSRRL